jgi:RND family efflux transporter MFP subunit
VLLAQAAIDIAAPVAGRLESVDVKVGDDVPAGSIVARLDVRSMEKELSIAEATLRRASTERDQAVLELDQARERESRLARLAEEAKAVSEQDLSMARHQQRLAAARLEGADASMGEQRTRVAQIRDAIAEARVKAPFAGVVAARYLDAGATISRGERILKLMTTGTPLVRFAVPESEARTVAVHQAVNVLLDGRDSPLAARISRISPDVDPPSQMIFVEATIADSGHVEEAVLVGAAARVFLGDSPARARR